MIQIRIVLNLPYVIAIFMHVSNDSTSKECMFS